MLNNKWLSLLLISLLALTGCASTGGQLAGSATDISRDSNAALQDLYASNPEARHLARRAKGILVFPGVVKAGFIGGAQYGSGGALFKNGRTAGYYNIAAVSYGLQAGVQSFNYALFFMDNDSLSYLIAAKAGKSASARVLSSLMREWLNHSLLRQRKAACMRSSSVRKG